MNGSRSRAMRSSFANRRARKGSTHLSSRQYSFWAFPIVQRTPPIGLDQGFCARPRRARGTGHLRGAEGAGHLTFTVIEPATWRGLLAESLLGIYEYAALKIVRVVFTRRKPRWENR